MTGRVGSGVSMRVMYGSSCSVITICLNAALGSGFHFSVGALAFVLAHPTRMIAPNEAITIFRFK